MLAEQTMRNTLLTVLICVAANTVLAQDNIIPLPEPKQTKIERYKRMQAEREAENARQEAEAARIKNEKLAAELQLLKDSQVTNALNDGIELSEGKKRPKDYAKASELLRKAAAANNPIAMRYLGRLYAEGGFGIESNIKEAVFWTKQSAEGGDPDGMADWGYILHFGIGDIKQDTSGGLDWLNKAATKGSTQSMRYLAKIYFVGKHIEKDLKKTYEWLKKGSDIGDPRAIAELAIALDNSDLRKLAGITNKDEMINYLEKSDRMGYTAASTALSLIHLGGDEIHGSKGTKEAAENLLKKAIKLYSSDAAFMLGFIKFQDKEYSQAIELLQTASERNSAEAMAFLSALYASGSHVPQNNELSATMLANAKAIRGSINAPQELRGSHNKITEEGLTDHRVLTYYFEGLVCRNYYPYLGRCEY